MTIKEARRAVSVASVKPGDFVYVVDLENLKITREKIYGVQITTDGKLSISEGKIEVSNKKFLGAKWHS